MERFNIATDSKTGEEFTVVDGDTRISVFADVFTGNRYAAGKYRVYRELKGSGRPDIQGKRQVRAV